MAKRELFGLRAFRLAALVLLALGGVPGIQGATAATQEQIDEAIQRALGYFRDHLSTLQRQELGIVTYAMIKGGESVDSPAVKTLLDRIETLKFPNGRYELVPGLQYYESGTDAMALCAAEDRRYAKEIDSLVDLMVANQAPAGSWFYRNQGDSGGDTSITQYAVLGLWAASRVGAHVPGNVWNKEADWHLRTQTGNGGFRYHPGEVSGGVTRTMTVNAVTSLCIARLYLYPKGDYTVVVPADSEKMPNAGSMTIKPMEMEGAEPVDTGPTSRFGVLKKVDLSSGGRKQQRVRPRGPASTAVSPSMSLDKLNGAIGNGVAWMRINYSITHQPFQIYYLYGLERMCALAGVKDFDGHDWYQEGSDFLLKSQKKDGSFDDTAGPNSGTAFAVLFLSRATAKIFAHGTAVNLYGGGLMIGGRGLPNNLNSVRLSGEGIKVKKLDAPIDQLLSELENPKSVKVEEAQQALVEKVITGDREKLIGQKERLRNLLQSSKGNMPRQVEVRRTAIWALGRCATIHDASTLIKALDDPDPSVVVEANNALCWLARRPNGFAPPNPLADLPETASEQEKEALSVAWREKICSKWREWFDRVRPYSESDLPLDLPTSEDFDRPAPRKFKSTQ